MIRTALALSLLALAAAASAVMLDFEHLSGGVPSSNGTVTYASPLATQGYVLSGTSGFAALTDASKSYNYTGSTALIPNPTASGNGPNTRWLAAVARADGGTFDALSIDLATSVAGQKSSVLFRGFDAGRVFVSQSVTVTSTMTTFVLAGFTGMTSMNMVATAVLPYGNQIDNLSVVASPVPEPAPLAALGAGAFALLRRRRARR